MTSPVAEMEKRRSTASLKVALSSFVLQSGYSGVATYIVNLLSHMQKNESAPSLDVFVPENDAHVLPAVGERCRVRSTSPLFAQPVASIAWHNTALPKIAASEKYDLVHIPTYRRVPWIKTCPVVITVHDLAALSCPKKYDRMRTFFNTKVVPNLLAKCDHLVAVSEYTKSDILRYCDIPEEKISVIYSGIDHQVYRPMLIDEAWKRLGQAYHLDQPFFVYVSRIEHPGKNHLNLLRAFESFKRRTLSKQKLILVGADWPGADVVRRAARESEFAHDIMILGFIPTEDVVALYSACDLMIHPSYFEGFGFPVVEAAACGARVLCSNTSSLAELGKMGGLEMFDPNDYVSIRTSMEQAAEQPVSKDEREGAISFASQFQWDRSIEQLLDVYEKVT